GFRPRGLDEVIADFESARRAGVRHLAFYDDALLYRLLEVLYPFLASVERTGGGMMLHTPNAMHARLVNQETARRLAVAGMKSFYLGYESVSAEFQRKTGAKVVGEDLAGAVEALRSAGVPAGAITAYEILGHPLADVQGIEESMRFASSLGIRVMLSDFSPIPGTPDGELCRGVVDLDEPLYHNKSAFPMLLLGPEKVDYYKNLCAALNRRNKELSQDRKDNYE
ncbi:MAG: radical SAM protein, partial [Anaerohalosphaeraceae bacterium]